MTALEVSGGDVWDNRHLQPGEHPELTHFNLQASAHCRLQGVRDFKSKLTSPRAPFLGKESENTANIKPP
jgi:hypothetical protein